MLRRMSSTQFEWWKTYNELDPIGADREDWRSASIVQALWNIARDPARVPDGWPLSDFLLGFGDNPKPKPVVQEKQSLEVQEMMIEGWISGSNSILRGKTT